ncbi:cysteine-rich secretory protein 3-like [Octodon degus]|uniref:Cysteine-rich secretory protein 3-like n=1 Tax=Octodon degus TaxID=10160 RepID=A0A6P3EYN9_OCTDE|nr:cysteine-rich secretory protein 3-like [Octodon degus]
MKQTPPPAARTNRAMALFPVPPFLVAVLLLSLPANGNVDPSFKDLSTALPQVQEEIVNKHNELRRAVSPSASDMVKMEWNSAAADNARTWADQCQYKHSLKEERQTTVNCGENLYMSSAPSSWSAAIQHWYDESKNFQFGKGPLSPTDVVGHYTQVVWHTSFQVGCAAAYCPNQPGLKYFMVCQYCPAGNNLARIYSPYKNGDPCASCPDHCEDGLCTNGCKYEDRYSNCESLKSSLSCDHYMVKENCLASCNCEDKIH